MTTQKQVIVITGGAGGIGMACAKTFKNEQLIITDYSDELVNKAVNELKKEAVAKLEKPKVRLTSDDLTFC